MDSAQLVALKGLRLKLNAYRSSREAARGHTTGKLVRNLRADDRRLCGFVLHQADDLVKELAYLLGGEA